MIDEIATALQRRTYRCSGEAELQDAISSVLEAGFPGQVSREHVLGRSDRVDFMVSGVAVEVKVGGSLAALTRQVHRYAAHDTVTGVLVVTTRWYHGGLPETLHGKPIGVLRVGVGL